VKNLRVDLVVLPWMSVLMDSDARAWDRPVSRTWWTVVVTEWSAPVCMVLQEIWNQLVFDSA